jgi:hypothetical protein
MTSSPVSERISFAHSENLEINIPDFHGTIKKRDMTVVQR